MYISIIGNAHSGKTVFLSLLYASQIKYSEESSGNFRFYSEPKVLEILGDYYNSLRSGKWPKKKKLSQDIIFTFGYEIESFSRKFKRLFNKSNEKDNISLDFGIYDLFEKDENKNKKSKRVDNTIPLMLKSGYTNSLVKSNILLFLLDSTKLGEDKNTDEGFSRVIDKAIRAGKYKIFPIVIFTKFDKINKDKLKMIKLPKKPPGLEEEEKRNKFGNALIKRYYPKLYKIISSRKPVYCYVHLKVTNGPKGKYIPALPKDPELELDYSYEEYEHLIEYLGKIGKSELS